VIFTSELQHMSKTMVDRWKPTKKINKQRKTQQNKTKQTNQH
jgi:hypothetical protein